MAKKKPYRFFLYLLLRLLAGAVNLVPERFASGLARRGGRAAFRLVARQREKTLANLRQAYGTEKSEAEITRLAEQVFENLALTALEVLRFPKLTAEKALARVDAGNAFETIERLLARGKGVLCLSAHLGNWELLAAIFVLQGHRPAVLARRLYYNPYDRWIVRLRRAVGVTTIYRDDSSREVLRRLAENEILGLLPDQDMDSSKGIFVPFFGRSAYTSIAPARLSIASGAPLVPTFLVRTSPERYRLVLGEPVLPDTRPDRDRAVRLMTEAWMKQFETVIRRHPEQWAWMHDRWKTGANQVKFKPKEALLAS